MIGIILSSFVVIVLLILGWDFFNKVNPEDKDEEKTHFYQDYFDNKN